MAKNENYFIENLTNEEVARTNSTLDSISFQGNMNLDDINAIVNHIENLFTSNSKATFGVKKQRKTKTNKNNNKPWFNFECHRARNEYHKIRKQYNKYKTDHDKNALKQVSKEYKNKIRDPKMIGFKS